MPWWLLWKRKVQGADVKRLEMWDPVGGPSPTDQIRRLNFLSALGHADLRTTQRYLSATQVRTVSASKAVVSALTQVGLQTARHSAHKHAS